MSGKESYQLNINPLLVHSFNKDKTEVAVCPNNNQVHIYKKAGNVWKLLHCLTEHDKLITGIDWAPNSNRIVTCSQDRNAYVWTTDGRTWKPTLVNLRINRAATTVRWSPQENKFAVASGAKLVCICYFEQDNNWWVSKHLKKPIKSTVLSVDWHPSNILLAVGSSDRKARVFSAFIKGVDEKGGDPVWGEKLPFGTVCGEYGNENSGWVEAVAFSPNGSTVAYASHDSTISVISPATGMSSTCKTPNLPVTSILFVSETQIIGAGYDCCPYLFQQVGNGWELVQKLDDGSKKSIQGSSNSAMNKFKQMDYRAQASGGDTELSTIHQNTITCLRAFSNYSDHVTKVSTTGIDGKLVIWDLLSVGVSGIKVR